MSTVGSDNTETPGQYFIDIHLKNGIVGIVAHTFNPSPRKPEAGGSSGVQGQPGLQREFQDYYREPLSENQSKQTNPHPTPPQNFCLPLMGGWCSATVALPTP